jgi:L,D-peptidoglycan transpeptidase YkuD (ErfK/YbiS/YcfS/YnhG family)
LPIWYPQSSHTLFTMPPRTLVHIHVQSRSGSKTRGILRAGGLFFPVALGRAGILANKREGDGGTPRGRFRLKKLWWRADRITRPRTGLPVRPIGPTDAWSEDPADRRYNRPVRRRPGEPGDRLMRDDGLYDLIIEIDHNDRPRIAGRGSAVFIHVARAGFGPTAGCVALRRNDLLRLLEMLSPRTWIHIG